MQAFLLFWAANTGHHKMFSIFDVPTESAEFSEQMGTKFKFWYQDERFALTLYKEGRPGTGENWAEKLASELAQLLGIPHATYELGEWRKRMGVISPSFVPEGARLIHGNELVGGKVTVANENAQLRFYAERTHTASRVFQYLKLGGDFLKPPQSYVPIKGVDSALGVFIGYLLFDVWVANQDRHSENWGVVQIQDELYLAPSYDHGSSLGRNETDERRHAMMTTQDRGTSIVAYVGRARSAMYPNAPADVKTKAYLGLDLFKHACKMDPVSAQAWVDRIREVTPGAMQDAIDQIPSDHMSDVAREFTAKLLKLNRNRLLALNIHK